MLDCMEIRRELHDSVYENATGFVFDLCIVFTVSSVCLDVCKCPPVILEFKLPLPNFEVELLVKHRERLCSK